VTAELTPEWAFDERDRGPMRRALDEARAAAVAGDVPVGAVVVNASGAIVAAAHNQRVAVGDPTAHAEILALREASRAAGSWRLDGHVLYVTLEPCAMCAAACVVSRLDAVVWGTPDEKAGFAGSLGNLLDDPRLNHRVGWRGGLLAGECAALLTDFFANLRGRG